jgi:DNA polymerase
VKVSQSRGLTKLDSTPAVLTIHPSYILTLKEKAQAEAEFAKFVADLNLARTCLPEAA